jgi:hypothetical protein
MCDSCSLLWLKTETAHPKLLSLESCVACRRGHREETGLQRVRAVRASISSSRRSGAMLSWIAARPTAPATSVATAGSRSRAGEQGATRIGSSGRLGARFARGLRGQAHKQVA